MSDNGDVRRATRTLHTFDLVSGDELSIAYFPRAGVVTINGYSVTRSQEIESLGGKTVFHRPLGNKVFTVATEKIATLFL